MAERAGGDAALLLDMLLAEPLEECAVRLQCGQGLGLVAGWSSVERFMNGQH
jgi:hypothetical protein